MIDEYSDVVQPYTAQAQLLKLLTHPVRLAILNLLRDGEHCVCHLEAHLGLRQAYISQQLMVLREAGMIQDRRDGWNVFYHVTQPGVFAVLAAVRELVPQAEPAMDRPGGVDCPCPKCNSAASS